MNELENVREEINSTDREMALLFERRMKAAAEIGKYKAENALPVRNEKRERALGEKNLTYIKTDELKAFYTEFLKKVIDLSCEYQQSIIGKYLSEHGGELK